MRSNGEARPAQWSLPRTLCSTWLAALLLAGGYLELADAASITWRGGATFGGLPDSWQNVNNWNPFGSPFSIHRVPGDSDTAILSTPAGDIVRLYGGTDPVNGVTIGNGILFETNGWHLNAEDAGAATVSVSGAGSLLRVSDSFAAGGGGMTQFTTDNLLLIAGGELRVAGDTTIRDKTTLIVGVMNDFSSSDTISFGGDIVVDNATMTLDEASLDFAPGIDFTARNNANVMLKNTASGVASSTIPVSMDGVYHVNSGADVEFGSITIGYDTDPALGSNGTLTVSDAGTLVAAGGITVGADAGGGTGRLTVSGGAVIDNTPGTTLVRSTGRIDIANDSTYGFGNLEVRAGGQINGAGNLDFDYGVADINGGSVSAVGNINILIPLNIASGGMLTASVVVVDGNGSLVVSDGTVNTGDLTVGNLTSSQLTISGPNAVVSQSPGAVLDVRDGTIQVNDRGTLANQGTVALAANATLIIDGGNVSLGSFSDKSGSISLVSGSLSYVGDLATPELAMFGSGGLILPTAAHLTITGNTTIAAGQSLTLDGGQLITTGLVANGQFNFQRGTLELVGGSVTGTALASMIVPTQGEIRGNGAINLPVTALPTSTITATGNLTLGDPAAVNGFYANGTVAVQSGVTTLADANEAVFDSAALVTLGDGSGGSATLSAAHGIVLDYGSNLTGFGTLNTPNDPTQPLIINGNIIGNSLAEPITLTGYVKGAGTCDQCTITGTDAPGSSPAAVNRGSVSYRGTLEIDIGGTLPGSGYDQLNHILGAGIADLGGVLDVNLVGGFSPASGDRFRIITATTVLGQFDAAVLPTLPPGLGWGLSYAPDGVVLIVSPPSDFDGDGDVDGSDLLAWQRGESPNPLSPMDLAAWQTNFGAASLAALSTVPEPSALAMLLLAAVLGMASGRRRGSNGI